jgi:hypothetical protein
MEMPQELTGSTNGTNGVGVIYFFITPTPLVQVQIAELFVAA